ncbi:MAG: FkbM family methyltransferase [Verrucomicrobiae bacterium]|nr:FkbM family methyltransferase [Verrucomicrobiae bacterium]
MEEVFPGRREGFFIELGALNGIQGSNTLPLERELDWNGICIESNPRYFSQLIRNRGCQCVMACVDETRSFAEFRLLAGKSGIIANDTDHNPVFSAQELRKARARKSVFLTPTVPLAEVLDACDAPELIEYLSLDVEGAELRVLRRFPWNRFRIGCLTVERPLRVLNRILRRQGYHFIRRVAMDSFYVHEDFFDEDKLGIKKGEWEEFPSWILRNGEKRFVGDRRWVVKN